MKKNYVQLVVSLAFLMSSIGLWNHLALTKSSSEQTTAVIQVAESQALQVAESQALQVAGVWDQYSIENGERVFMARLDLRSDGLDYQATPLSIAENVYPKHSYRSFDHGLEQNVWFFKEQWDNGEVGEFILSKISDGEYQGTALSSTGAGFETVFVRVSN